MDTSLLATKLRAPPQTQHLVPRARLVDALDQATADDACKLVLVTAPAGSGKTTLLAQWAHSSAARVAWVSLGEEENDPDRFFRYLLRAWETVQPDVGESPLGLLLGSMDPDRDTVLAAFVNVADTVADTTVFVLDDYHLITEPAIHTAMTFLLDHLPPTIHCVVASRGEPPLPLARYRARQALRELGGEDLRFQTDETDAFLNRQLGLGLSRKEIASLQAQVEGWAAGLQLVSLSLRRRGEGADVLPVSGRQRFIADYLSEDVLAHLSPDVQRFLFQTSILDRLSGSLCTAVTGRDDSQEMLERLERENLFLLPLDDQRTWFRYHRLFAEFLRESLARRDPDEVAELHRRAARWYLTRDMAEQAFEHAVAGNDVELVTRIGEDYCVIKMESGELNVVARWIQSIPEDWFATYPLLKLLKVAYLIYTGAFEESVRLLDEVEERMRQSPSRDTRAQLAKAATIRCAIACFQNDLPLAEAYASGALDDLPAEADFYRASIYHALGETYGRNAYWDQAAEAYHKALQIVHDPTWRIRSVHIYGALADLELRQGHLQTAGDYWSKALATIQEREMWGRLPIPVTGWVSIRMGELLFERNRLAEAWSHLTRGLELAELGGDLRSLIAGHLLRARLHLAEGKMDQASEALDRARLLLDQARFPEWPCRFNRCQLELWLAQDRLRAVANWVDSAASDGTGDEREVEQVTLCRALIVRGQRADRERALGILRPLIEEAETHGRKGIQIEALALQALARWAEGDRAGAMTSLQRALSVAEPEGYARLFVDLGLPMARLLQEAQARQVMPTYAGSLLDAFALDGALPGGLATVLPQPLSEREQDVLDLMAAGLTNREIGEKLFISAETVKKHSSSIYAKLQVGHRTEAVARARELGLLDTAR